VTHTYLGIALAYMGRRMDAIREGERGLALVPISQGSAARQDPQHNLARIYVLAGEPEKALDLLEPLIETNYLSPGRARIDPAFAPLRGNPRFERLVAGK
jgi:Flp pilus assembly protein TadD